MGVGGGIRSLCEAEKVPLFSFPNLGKMNEKKLVLVNKVLSIMGEILMFLHLYFELEPF